MYVCSKHEGLGHACIGCTAEVHHHLAEGDQVGKLLRLDGAQQVADFLLPLRILCSMCIMTMQHRVAAALRCWLLEVAVI